LLVLKGQKVKFTMLGSNTVNPLSSPLVSHILESVNGDRFPIDVTPSSKDRPFPKMGVKFSVFLDFIENNGGNERFVGKSTTDVCNEILKPVTEARQLSYCEFVQGLNTNSQEVGEAEVFISHAWKYIFLDVVSAIQSHFKNTPDIYIWFDLFSNNQHLAGNLPFEWWTNTFKSAIKQFGRTVMVLSPWKNPIPFTRAWCLFEITVLL